MILTTEHIKQVITDYFKAKPVKKVWLFGSYARGEADEVSDVDLLLDLDLNAKIGIEFYSWFRELAEILNKKTDLVCSGSESKYIKPFIDNDKLIIYER